MMKLLKKGSLIALALILCASNIASTNVLAVGNTYIAINSGENSTYNVGRRIDSNILHFVYNNPNL